MNFRGVYLKEEEIRPKKLFQKYLDLCRQDIENMDRTILQDVTCPGCGKENDNRHLLKNGFQYFLCISCGTLYCSPRPGLEQLERFYSEGQSAEFWNKDFFPVVVEARREKIFRPRAEKARDILKQKQIIPKNICDVGAGHGILLEELRNIFPAKFYALEPNPVCASQCYTKGFKTIETCAEKSEAWEGKFDLVLCTELIEHVFSTHIFINSLYDLIVPGGVCILTGLGYEGYDILTLQDKSNSLFPPHHLNFLSIKGFETLFRSAGFRFIEITTPGDLDADIVYNSEINNEFIRVLYTRGKSAVTAFQSFLQQYQLSSHVWVVATK